MSQRLLKEFRGMFPAWCIVALLCIMAPLAANLPFAAQLGNMEGEEIPSQSFIREITPLFLAAAFCLAASVVYTSEFHFRTLQLVMAQPISRARIWSEKLLVVSAGLLPVIALYIFLLWQTVPQPTFDAWPQHRSVLTRQSFFWMLFALTTICSAGFWSLVARNLIGSMTLNLAAQMLSLLLLNYGLKALGMHTGLFDASDHADSALQEARIAPPLLFSAFAYAGIFAWLGWSRFRRLELAESVSGSHTGGTVEKFTGKAEISSALSFQHQPWMALFIRKEISLQKPTLFLGAVFCVLWIAFLGLSAVFGGQRENKAELLGLLSAFYVPMSVILAGCISIAEESRIGIFEWHLTFPLSVRRLWAIKGLLGALFAGIFSLVLPIALGFATFFKEITPNLHQDVLDAWPVLLMLALLFLVSFWASSFLRDTIRATLGAVMVILAGFLLAMFAGWSASELGGLQTGLLVWITASLQVSFFEVWSRVPQVCATLWILVMPILLAWQSLRAFKRNSAGVWPFLKSSVIVLGVALCVAFGTMDLIYSSMRLDTSVLQRDIIRAVAALPEAPYVNERRILSFQELDKTGCLAPVTQRWIKGCNLSLQPTRKPHSGGSVFSIRFPSGASEAIQVPRAPVNEEYVPQ